MIYLGACFPSLQHARKKFLVFLVQMLLYHGVSFFLARSKANKTPVPAFKIQQKGKKISRKVTKRFSDPHKQCREESSRLIKS